MVVEHLAARYFPQELVESKTEQNKDRMLDLKVIRWTETKYMSVLLEQCRQMYAYCIHQFQWCVCGAAPKWLKVMGVPNLTMQITCSFFNQSVCSYSLKSHSEPLVTFHEYNACLLPWISPTPILKSELKPCLNFEMKYGGRVSQSKKRRKKTKQRKHGDSANENRRKRGV